MPQIIKRKSDGRRVVVQTPIHERKLLDMIETEMKKYARDDFNKLGFVFPNGAVYYVNEYHELTALKIAKTLKIDYKKGPLNYFMSLGIARFGFNSGAFYVETRAPLCRTAEKTVIDVSFNHTYEFAVVDLPGWRHEEVLKGRLEERAVDF